MQVSRFVSLKELTKSPTAIRLGIDNTPTDAHIQNLKKVCEEVFDRVRELFMVPIAITSGYRSEALNKAIHGSEKSQHTEGRAIDIDADVYKGVTNKQIFDYIKKHLDFDQLIWECGDDENPDWVHVSYVEGKNRKDVLSAIRDSEGKVTYMPYSPSKQQK